MGLSVVHTNGVIARLSQPAWINTDKKANIISKKLHPPLYFRVHIYKYTVATDTEVHYYYVVVE